MKGKMMVMLVSLSLLSGGLMLAWAQSKAVSDNDISLRKGGLLGTYSEEAPVYPDTDAGDSEVIPRAFFGAPPMVPHTVEAMATGIETNDCLDCHGEADEDTPGLPPSHFIKGKYVILDRAKARQGMVTVLDGFSKVTSVTGLRFDCILCHAPQAENVKLLVDNTFQPVDPKDTQKKALEAVLQQLNEEGEF